MTRFAEIDRATAETRIHLELELDGDGQGTRSTGVGFFDHMLDLLARHGRMNLTVQAEGDLQTGAHHTVEDVGICLGQALDRALGDRAGITRYGQATVPMDESRASCAIDISGRGLCAFQAQLPAGAIGNFDHELAEEFLRALATNARLTLHVTIEAGTNAHHVIEAAFKAVARALRAAVAIDPTEAGVPSTKGTLYRRPRIAVIDYGMGNRRSVQKALEHVGAEAEITRDHERIAAAEGVVLPGVGAFPRGMQNLIELGLDAALRATVAESRPLLGICLGMQLLFEGSEEFGSAAGLGFIPGPVTPLDAAGLRVPHIGWNEVRFERPSPLTAGLPSTGCAFYHVHSLAGPPRSAEDVVATTEYGERFATIVARGSVLGVQFHPEKSSAHGLHMLGNFVRTCGRGVEAGAGASALRA